MPILPEFPHRSSSYSAMVSLGLEDRFELIKDIGDGSFGSVALARVRTAGSNVAKRGTLVAIKTMKKTFESFQPCLELREVTFLRTLPNHAHLVPALDIFLDPMTKKLHICMEYMDGNLYQLMKSRDHKCLDVSIVKSILYQILSGLDHIHTNSFFHRDIKPENILVSANASMESSSFRRYSSIMTPPSTPSMYTIKIADFGLARETQSKLPYTTYVSTRWYRAPEVLLRAGEYSAPVDMWALGAMAVEIATLKPLFPGGNEVEQVWRVCEIMGSPGNWYNRSGAKVGGGDWRDGTRLAQKMGFSFPKMAPHAMDSILQPPQWPVAFSNFVTWCLMWDPKNRPTSLQAMQHEFFSDAVDPLSSKVASSKLLGKKASTNDARLSRDMVDAPTLVTKPSWFRKSFVGRDSSSHQQFSPSQNIPADPSPAHASTIPLAQTASKPRANAGKRATWANGSTNAGQAPMHILPSIRPISPLSATVHAQASSKIDSKVVEQTKTPKKIGRQLSVQSHGNHYSDIHHREAERVLNGQSGVTSPTNGQKESFFSHLRKRARRLSGRHQIPVSPPRHDDIEASAGYPGYASNRSSMALDPSIVAETQGETDYLQLNKALLENVRGTLETPVPSPVPPQHNSQVHRQNSTNSVSLKPSGSVSQTRTPRSRDEPSTTPQGPMPASTRSTRRPMHVSNHNSHRYETPDEEDELLDEALNSVRRAMRGIDRNNQDASRNALVSKDANSQTSQHLLPGTNPYPTPSPSAKRNSESFRHALLAEPATPLHVHKTRSGESQSATWPTPPYEENEWAASAAASIFAAGSMYR
ncbi:hypothetical protein MMC25_002772 [Agyrium rufum]|nr:hypothetical protein [Agyrium rufum]